MRWLFAALLLTQSTSSQAGDAKPSGITFAKEHVGKLPPHWKAERAGEGEGSVWKVQTDETAPSKSGHVLAQTAASPRTMFNLCVLDGTKAKDVEISVHFKAVLGDVDQGGGVVWRYQDAKNYYVARMNPLEDNYRLYKVVDGKRIQLATAEKIKVAPGAWTQLSIKHVGSKIECSFDDKKLLDAEDDAIPAAGRTGLWTKADARTRFDLFSVRAHDSKGK